MICLCRYTIAGMQRIGLPGHPGDTPAGVNPAPVPVHRALLSTESEHHDVWNSRRHWNSLDLHHKESITLSMKNWTGERRRARPANRDIDHRVKRLGNSDGLTNNLDRGTSLCITTRKKCTTCKGNRPPYPRATIESQWSQGPWESA